jgi:hypothetical protein
MKCRVVQHDDRSCLQLRQQHLLQPLVKHFGVARSLKQHGRNQFALAVSANQTGSWSLLSALQAPHALTLGCPAVLTVCAWGKAGFIQINQGLIVALSSPMAQQIALAQVAPPIGEGLGVAQRFFYDSCPLP